MGKQAGRNPGRNAGQGRGSGPQPITRHPLFPVLLALWFGALFGLGSLAVRIGLVEALVLKLRIDLILPFAAPPLGMKARALIALAMAITGALAGLWLGRRLREGSQPKPRSASPQGLVATLKRAVRRENPAPTARRRALSVSEEPGSGWSGDIAPLPGQRPQVLSASDYDFITPLPEAKPAAVPAAKAEPVEPAPLDLVTFLPEAEAGPAARPFDAPSTDELAAGDLAADQPETGPLPKAETPVPAARPFAPPQHLAEPAEPAPVPEAARELEVLPAGGMTHLDLVNQLAEAMRARRDRLAAARSAAAAAPAPVDPVTEALTAFEPIHFEPVAFEPVGTAANEPETSATMPDAVTAVAAPLPRFGPAPEPEARGPAPLPQMPAALRPLALDEEDEAELDISHVPLRSISMAAPEAAAQDGLPDRDDEPETASDEALEDGYSSLLDLSRPAQPRHSFIRIEDREADATPPEPEPVVIFPGQAPRPFDMPRTAGPEPLQAPAAIPQAQAAAAPVDAQRPFAAPATAAPASIPAVLADREETERALRTALATLQRMSGAA